jgi:trans-2,3-dihydro-3-hydroxyanthranilate isomerase
MSSPYALCDVFAERPFTGNPLAVFLDADALSDRTMLSIAREFGWSEVTFVARRGDAGPFAVRIWTPQGELPFAGHPTVGTAVVLACTGRIDAGWSMLELGIGPVAVEVELTGERSGRATMTQPTPSFGAVFTDRARLARSLNLREEDLVPELPAQVVSTGLDHFLVPIRSLQALGEAEPSPDLPAVIAQTGCHWAYLFSVDTPDSAAAARARLVRPGFEDPATGSAAGPLGAYLVRYGLRRAGSMDIEQGVEMGRPSRIEVGVPLEGGELGPVRVSGEVHIWATGTLVGIDNGNQ